MNRIISFCKQYKHALLPILYAPVYLLIFFYLEKKPVSQIHVIEMSIDRKIPFCEYFVIPYYLWFLYVAATVITFVFLERKDYYKLCLTLGVGMTLFLIVSYVYPNGLQLRPTTFARDNFCVSLVKAMYATDTPTRTSVPVWSICSTRLTRTRMYFQASTALTPWHAMQRSVTTKKSEPSDRSDMAPYCSLLLLYCQHSSSNSTPCLMY